MSSPIQSFATSLSRDSFFWTEDAFTRESTIPPPLIPRTLGDNVNCMARQFCPYWDCLRPMCILHCMGLYSILYMFHEYLLTFWIVYGPFEPRPPKRPTLTSSKLRDKTLASAKGPCSPSCFLHITNVVSTLVLYISLF